MHFLYTHRFSLMHTFCTLLCPSDNQPITELFRQSLISNSVLHYNKQSFMFSSAWIGVIFWQRMGGQLHMQQCPAYFIYDFLSEHNGSKSEPIIGWIFWYWKQVLWLTHIQQDLNVNNYYSNKAAFIQVPQAGYAVFHTAWVPVLPYTQKLLFTIKFCYFSG